MHSNEHKRGRAQRFAPANLTAEQRALYDAIVGGPRSSGPQAFRLTDDDGVLEGPFNALLYRPDIGTAVQALGSALRYHGALAPRAREIAILEISVQRRCEFEWYAHERVGLVAGLSVDEIAAVRDGRDAATFSPQEVTVREIVRTLTRAGDLDDAAFAAAEATLGAALLMEIVTLVGYYDLLALSLRVWRTPLPQGATPTFADADAAQS
jgi:alkylhydroperoxidase family enzyme